MRNLLYILILLPIAFTGCEKEKENEKKITLVKSITFNDIQILFEYDNQNRLVKRTRKKNTDMYVPEYIIDSLKYESYKVTCLRINNGDTTNFGFFSLNASGYAESYTSSANRVSSFLDYNESGFIVKYLSSTSATASFTVNFTIKDDNYFTVGKDTILYYDQDASFKQNIFLFDFWGIDNLEIYSLNFMYLSCDFFGKSSKKLIKSYKQYCKDNTCSSYDFNYDFNNDGTVSRVTMKDIRYGTTKYFNINY